MPQRKFSEKKLYELLAAFIVWFALILQLVLIIQNVRQAGLTYAAEVVRYFSYMTILSNIFVACCFTFQLVGTQTSFGRLLSKASVQAAIFVYIFIVGVLNHLLLSHLSNLTGLQLLCDRLLHYVVPVLYMAWWFIFVTKKKLPYGDILFWLIFPLLYVIYCLVRGSVSGLYPYPFLNVAEHGYPVVFKMMGIITAVYVLTSLLLVFINNKITKR